MKKYLLFIALFIGTLAANSQENAFSINGGWAWGGLKDSDSDASGWKLTGVYDLNTNGGKLSHGLGLAYIGITVDDVLDFEGESGDVKLNSYPLYYQPKVTFGEGKAQVFINGALGMHLSGYKIMPTQGGSIKTTQAGFYGGVGGGLMISVTDEIYLNATYEWAYLSNSYLNNGYLHSALIGIGFKF